MKYFLLLFGLVLSAQEKASFYFDFNKETFNPKQNELFLKWLNQNNDKEVLVINGYCDWYGTLDYNDSLAYRRINTVYNELKDKSIISFSETLIIKGFGERTRMNSKQELNRRVDILFKIKHKSIPNVEKTEELKTVEVPNILLPDSEPIDFNEEVVELPTKKDEQYDSVKVGDKLILNNLYFYDRSGIFVPESLPVMEGLLEFMVSHPKVKIEIQGHICCQLGEDPEDIALIRAIAVHNYLVANDIDDERLNFKSFGSTNPIHKIPEKNEVERNENRRVEILILEN